VIELAVLLPLRLVSTPNLREHWAKRARRAAEHRAAVRMRFATERAWPPRLPVHVTITRVAPRALDGDNLQGACKAIRDGIADALGVDDGDAAVHWSYEQRRGVAREYGVELRVAELGEHEGTAA
jgi:hypothetical protein